MNKLSNLSPVNSAYMPTSTMFAIALVLTFVTACGGESSSSIAEDTVDSTDVEDNQFEGLPPGTTDTEEDLLNPRASNNPEIIEDNNECGVTNLYERSADPSERGPWSVGVKTVQLGRLNVEVLYPAVPGSEEGLTPMEVDIRYAIPASEQSKVTDDVRPIQNCDCYTELPLDLEHGPYPLVLFVHGTASWRTQSLSLMEHWASRGFIVASADHPGLWLSDLLGNFCGVPPSGGQDLLGDLKAVLNGFNSRVEGLNFLAGKVNLDRVAVIGHSAGGGAATAASNLDGVQVVISMAGNSPTKASDLKAALFLGGMTDSVVAFSQTQAAYKNTTAPRRLVGIADGAHLVFSDICEITNTEGKDLVQIATEAGVCGTQFASFLFDCAASTIPAKDAGKIIKSATTWELERHLHCNKSLKEFGDFGEQNSWVEVLESAEGE